MPGKENCLCISGWGLILSNLSKNISLHSAHSGPLCLLFPLLCSFSKCWIFTWTFIVLSLLKDTIKCHREHQPGAESIMSLPVPYFQIPVEYFNTKMIQWLKHRFYESWTCKRHRLMLIFIYTLIPPFTLYSLEPFMDFQRYISFYQHSII